MLPQSVRLEERWLHFEIQSIIDYHKLSRHYIIFACVIMQTGIDQMLMQAYFVVGHIY